MEKTILTLDFLSHITIIPIMKPTQEDVDKAIETIIAYGATHYNDPSSVGRGRMFGMGVSEVSADPQFLMFAAAECSEAWNGRVEANILRKLAVGKYEFDKEAGTAKFNI